MLQFYAFSLKRKNNLGSQPSVCVCVFSTVCVPMGVRIRPHASASLPMLDVFWLVALKAFEVWGVIWVSAVALMVKVGEQGSHRVRVCLSGQLESLNEAIRYVSVFEASLDEGLPLRVSVYEAAVENQVTTVNSTWKTPNSTSSLLPPSLLL